MLLMLPLTWLILTRVVNRVTEDADTTGRSVGAALDPLNRGARITLGVFACTVTAWLFRSLLVQLEIGGRLPLAGLTDSGIAMLAALALFVIPVDLARGDFVLDWPHAVRLPWGVLLLFGGGLSLAAALDQNGVGLFLGAQVSAWKGVHPSILLLLVSTMVLFLTELTSNTATAATLVPVLAGLAPGLGVHPLLLILPTGIAASWAFMLPAGTPPNAIVFGSGHVTMRDMRRAGLWLNLTGLVILTVFMYWVALPFLGVSP
jgi:sodium-dependent dicarboxylate transporter 2/3/5